MGLMLVAGGWLISDSIQPRNASFPSGMDSGTGSLLAGLGFTLGALIFVRDTYFKWREDQRAERAEKRKAKGSDNDG